MAATDLTLPATVAAELGVSASDERLPRYIAVASDAARQYLNRDPLHYEAGIVETVAGFGTARLVLQRLPVLSIASIEFDGQAISADAYEIEDGGAGLVFRRVGWPWTTTDAGGIVGGPLPGYERRLLEVTYTGGWVTPGQTGTRTLPYDIEEAVIQTVVGMYRSRGRDREIASESLGAASVTYARGGEGGVLPATAKALLTPYRLIR